LSIISIPGISEPIASISHLFMAFATIYFGYRSVSRSAQKNPPNLSLKIFLLSACFLFVMSGFYHLVDDSNPFRTTLRRLDHAAIWVMIIGTFTSLHLHFFERWALWGMLFLIWVVGITGMTIELVYFNSFPEWLSTSLYLLLGWAGLVSGILYFQKFGKKRLWLLVAGGLAYSIGATLDFLRYPILLRGVFGPHEIFHFFVIAGALCHGWFIFGADNILLEHRKKLHRNNA
jgi:hemolysin III